MIVDSQYLEEKYPKHPLLPTDIHKRAINFQAVSIVSSSIQPLQNSSLLKYIEGKAGPDEKLSWAQTVIKKGFTALEKLLKEHTGRYATGDEVSMADIFLAPQIHSAFKKFNIDMGVLYGLLMSSQFYQDYTRRIMRSQHSGRLCQRISQMHQASSVNNLEADVRLEKLHQDLLI
ncbi:glutathione S-transferase zeta class [Trifolium repens]|nr:glutathione S-transferase zeta class [Trifolium repens]